MPLSYILSNLLADVPKAEAVVLVDAEGETVEVMSARLQPYDMKVQGAYEGIHFRQLNKRQPGLESYYYIGRDLSVFTTRVGAGYYLVVITGGGAHPGRILNLLTRARADIEEGVL